MSKENEMNEANEMLRTIKAFDKISQELLTTDQLLENVDDVVLVKSALQRVNAAKAFEFILKKLINVNDIVECESADEYNTGILNKKRRLTEEQFKWLKDLIMSDYYWILA